MWIIFQHVADRLKENLIVFYNSVAEEEKALYKNLKSKSNRSIFVSRLFEEKRGDMVFGFPCGVVRYAWSMVRGSEFVIGTL